MLKKNKNYKDIAAAYMKLIKPRKSSQEDIRFGNEYLTSRPLSKISEEKTSQQTNIRPNVEINEPK